MLAYFLRGGNLPWIGLGDSKMKNTDSESEYYLLSKRARRILKIKEETSFEDLFFGNSVQFINYLKYCRKIPFEACPDYEYCRSLMRSVIFEE